MFQVIYECQSHQDYQGSMQWLLNFLEEYASHGRTIASHGKDSHQQLTSDPNLQTSMRELRTLLERFANGRSLDTIGDTMRAVRGSAAGRAAAALVPQCGRVCPRGAPPAGLHPR